MKQHQLNPVFKETQLFDWDAEPLQERADSFFLESAGAPLTSRPMRGSGPPGGVLLLAIGLVLGVGFVVLVELTPMLHRLLG